MGGAGDEVDDVLLVPPHHSVFFLSEKPEDRNFFRRSPVLNKPSLIIDKTGINQSVNRISKFRCWWYPSSPGIWFSLGWLLWVQDMI